MPFSGDKELARVSPLSNVPTLIDGDLNTADSKVICRDLESAYPEPGKTEFSQDVDHKWAALSRSTAMATVPVISSATIRLVPLLIGIVIGLVLDRIGNRSSNTP